MAKFTIVRVMALATMMACVCPFTIDAAAKAPTPVFTEAELALCGGKIRIPEMVWTPSRILLVAQCRCWGFPVAKSGGCDHPAPPATGDGSTNSTPPLTDNMIYTKVVTKASADNGRTWENFTVVTPISYSHGMPVYDRVAKQVVLQYQYHPNVEPTLNSTLFQRVSRDDGLTWGPARDITAQIQGCNPEAPQEMQVIAAGSKIQTASGRLMFSGHTHGKTTGKACIWFSDDHGKTYDTFGRFEGARRRFRGTPDCNESAALHSCGLDSSLSLRVLQNFDRMPHTNRSPRGSAGAPDGFGRAPLSRAERRVLRRKTALDQELYEYAVARFEAQLNFYESSAVDGRRRGVDQVM